MKFEALKKYLKGLPKVYWIYAILILIAEIIGFATHPDEPGLYTHNTQFLPLALALPFFIARNIRKNFRRSLYTYIALQFSFLAADYLISSHAGLIQLTFTFVPAFIFWLVLFAIWNVKQIRQADSRRALLLSAIAWGLFAFAFPPLPLGPAALLLLVPWFIVLNRYTRGQAIFATFWSGMLYNTINYYWIYNVMNVETAPSGLICFGVMLLIAYFSAYSVLAAFIYSLAREIKIKGHAWLLILYPIFYAGLEMTRTRGDFAFPWSHLGYTLGSNLELLQMLSFIGIFGYTILIIASNMIVAKALERPGIKSKWPIFAPVAIFLALLIHGSIVLSRPEAQPFYGIDNENSPNIAMIQPSIKQGEKWSKARFYSITTKTFGMINDSVHPGTNIIILAETAIPDHIRRQPATIDQLFDLSKKHHAAILTGALDFKRNPKGSPRKYDIYNASFLFSEDYPSYQRYIKKHLVPFSERIPFDEIFPILNYVDLGEGDFVPGKETPVYEPYKWTPFICYDAIFGDLVRESINAGSRLMVNITNDGWFGRSTAPFQHLNLVRYRAIENGIPAARLANSGISSFIDQYGHYSLNTEIFTDRVIQRKMQLKTRDTLYQHIGDSVETALLWFFLVYVVACFAGKVLETRAKA
ncbi:MAG: apolipoprotein N-acyltransferase [Fibrobacter sp.]|nr:apolipoprotein N-acyltransferase [Fibrobacter sp.]